MSLRIANPHQAARLTIPLMKMIEPPSPTTQILPTTMKSAIAPSVARETFDPTVADMDLSLIN